MAIGDRAVVHYRISEEDLQRFAEISGDWNPLHFDETYAAKTIFRKRIAHGMISVAKFSGIFGMELPGLGTLWETQEVRFSSAVFLNQDYMAIAEVTGKDRKRVFFDTWVEDAEGRRVIEGKASVVPITEGARKRLNAVP